MGGRGRRDGGSLTGQALCEVQGELKARRVTVRDRGR